MNGAQLVVTRSIKTTTDENPIYLREILTALSRYKKRDWGELSDNDKLANDEALASGDERIFAAYDTTQGKIYIITEADRSVTTVLFAHEY